MNVLDDLGLDPVDQLTSIIHLLKVKPSDYSSASQSVPKSLSATIQAMRQIES